MHALAGSDVGETVENMLLEWMETSFGQNSIGSVSTAQKAIHPNASGSLCPLLPLVDNISKISRTTLRAWIRTFFNYLWRWQGGKGLVPWKKLQSDTAHEYIEQSQMPPGINIMKDPHDTGRKTLITWYKHIVAGQLNKLEDSKVFQFSHVNPEPALPPIFYSSLLKVQAVNSELQYAPEEKLYALKVARGHTEQPSTANWHGLPLAQTMDFFEPFNEATLKALRDISTEQNRLDILLVLLEDMEKRSPVHTTMVAHPQGLHPLFPANLVSTDMIALLNRSLLPPEVFDSSLPDHDLYALATLTSAMRSPNNPFWHAPSSTWRGGPQGRSNAWKEGLVSQHLKNQMLTSPHFQPSSVPCTHGIPSSPEEVASMYKRLSESNPNKTLGAANDLKAPPSPPLASRRVRRPAAKPSRVVSDSDSDSDSNLKTPFVPQQAKNKSFSKEYIDIGINDLDSSNEDTIIAGINIRTFIEEKSTSSPTPLTQPKTVEEDTSLGNITTSADTAIHIEKSEQGTSDLHQSHENEEEPVAESSSPILPPDLTASTDNTSFDAQQPALDPPATTLRHTECRHVRTAEAQAAIDLIQPKKKGSEN
ncbi:hypothetical protein FRC09_016331 [Ceratobasidium sp. 395]|nr:hypothetical protein FRC09_016331 [Ceratobasidium sp. 395]